MLELGEDLLADAILVELGLNGGDHVVDDGAVYGGLIEEQYGHLLATTDRVRRAAHHYFIGHGRSGPVVVADSEREKGAARWWWWEARGSHLYKVAVVRKGQSPIETPPGLDARARTDHHDAPKHSMGRDGPLRILVGGDTFVCGAQPP